MGSAMSSERRAAHRHRVTFNLVFDDGEAFDDAIVVDISGSGVLVQTGRPRPAGTHVRLVPVGDAGKIVLDLPARVVRVVEGRGGTIRLGMRFEPLDEAQRAAVKRLCGEMPSTGTAVYDLAPDPPGLPDEPSDKSSAHLRIRAAHDKTPTQPRYTRRLL